MRPETKFLNRLAALFGEPNRTDVGATVAEYENALRGQSAATLDIAADLIARERTIHAWPTVAECFEAVKRAKQRESAAAIGLEPIKNFETWWAEQIGRIKTATLDRELSDVLRTIEPYAHAKWIATGRLAEAQAAADVRHKSFGARSAADTSRRMTGERE